jgi:hypothetical protein
LSAAVGGAVSDGNPLASDVDAGAGVSSPISSSMVEQAPVLKANAITTARRTNVLVIPSSLNILGIQPFRYTGARHLFQAEVVAKSMNSCGKWT